MPRERITTEHSPESWENEVKKYEMGEVVDIYARSSYPELIKREKELAEMIGAPDAALFNSGMAAIHTAVEAENLKSGDVVLCGRDVYSQTKKIYESLEKRGVKIIKIDSGDMEEVKKEIEKEKPRLIILEIVANSPQMQVCDIKSLAEMTEGVNKKYQKEFTPDKILDNYFSKRKNYKDLPIEIKEKILSEIEEFKIGNNPFIFREGIRILENETKLPRKEAIREMSRLVKNVISQSRGKLSLIIDNTLSSPVLHNPLRDLKGHDIEAVVVESGTKHYQEGEDKITLGISYSNDLEKIKKIKEKRTEIGTYLQPMDEKKIPARITKTMPDIMKRHAENALELAKLLSGSKKVLEVSHPNLPEHKQNELAKEIAPEGLVTLFYLMVENAPEFVKKVKELGGDKIGVGGSFGHKKTWLFNMGQNQIRIAAGSESEEEFKEISNIFEIALEK